MTRYLNHIAAVMRANDAIYGRGHCLREAMFTLALLPVFWLLVCGFLAAFGGE